jgi:GDPmannose 4,6-dehydratase
VKVDKKYFRATEVFKLQGDSNKAKKKLKWFPEFTIDQLIKEMVQEDIKLLENK